MTVICVCPPLSFSVTKQPLNRINIAFYDFDFFAADFDI